MSESKYDVIIIGSGILGSSMAYALGEQNRKVVVIERDFSEPNRIVGELLQPGGRRALDKLGMTGCLEGFDAHTIRGYVIHNSDCNSKVKLEYPNAFTDDLSAGIAFHHGKFIMSLRKQAMQNKQTTYIEGTAKDLITENGIILGVKYMERDSGNIKEIKAALTIVADGCFSRYRKTLVSVEPSVPSHFAGLILENCPQETSNHAELILINPSPVLIYQISSNHTRCLIDIKGKMPNDITKYLLDEISPKLPEHIRPSFIKAAKSDKPRCMPNSWLPPTPIIKPGVICMGDAVNMRHPLTGGGMTVAFNDVVLFRDLFADLSTFDDLNIVQSRARIFYSKRRIQQSFVVNVMSLALYQLFSADDDHLNKLKVSCFEYFKLGGNCIDGPISLLNITDPRPKLLLQHFLYVALYAVYLEFTNTSWWCIHRTIPSSLGIMYKATSIIWPLIWDEVKSMKA